MRRRTEEEISHLGMDEKSTERGHTYASILTDIDRSRVLDLVPELKLEAAVGLLEMLTPTQRLSGKAVAMDMWPAHISATRQCMPQADIVHDKFHISTYLGEAVEAARRQEHCKLSQTGTAPLTDSEWAWLKKYSDGRSAEDVSFRALNQLNLKTSRAWCIKENFRQFWSYSYKGAAKRFFKAWSNNAMSSKLEPVKKRWSRCSGATRRDCSTSTSTESTTPVQKDSTVPSNSSRPMPAGFVTSLTTGQEFCFIVEI